MSTLRIVFLSLLFASATLCSAAADHQNSVDTFKSWEYGGKNTGGQFETITEGTPASEHFQGSRVAQHENRASGLILGQEEDQVKGITSGINNPNLTYPYALAVYYIGGDNVAIDQASNGSPVGIALKVWHMMPAVDRSLWGTMLLRGQSVLRVKHNAKVRFTYGDPIVYTKTSLQRHVYFRSFLVRGGSQRPFDRCKGTVLAAKRSGQLQATMTDVLGYDKCALDKQRVKLSLRLSKRRILRLPRNVNRLPILPLPTRFGIARWIFEGAKESAFYGPRD